MLRTECCRALGMRAIFRTIRPAQALGVVEPDVALAVVEGAARLRLEFEADVEIAGENHHAAHRRRPRLLVDVLHARCHVERHRLRRLDGGLAHKTDKADRIGSDLVGGELTRRIAVRSADINR